MERAAILFLNYLSWFIEIMFKKNNRKYFETVTNMFFLNNCENYFSGKNLNYLLYLYWQIFLSYVCKQILIIEVEIL